MVAINYQPTFSPLDKVVELSSKIEDLYKELLQSEREKAEVLTNANQSLLDLVAEIKRLQDKK